MDKLGLKTIPHAKLYKLSWLSEEGEIKVIKVDKQVLINFSIGNYKDEVLCDLVPMEATHILLGRPTTKKTKITDGILSTDILLSVNLNYRWILPTDS